MSSPTTTATSYWCHRCTRFVQIRTTTTTTLTCPNCNAGFIERLETPLPITQFDTHNDRRRLPILTTTTITHRNMRSRGGGQGLRRGGGGGEGDRSLINPVIVLRGARESSEASSNGFELYYDDGGGTELRRLPQSMSDFLLRSGFDMVLQQLPNIDVNGGLITNHLPPPAASKAAVESMPTVVIDEDCAAEMDLHCPVCKERFELGSEARQMPCEHIYHQDCILPWLSMRNSCPVCRHELPAEVQEVGDLRGQMGGDLTRDREDNEEENQAVGLTIWRLPGGRYAVGRFTGLRRGGGGGGGGGEGERELPVVYTERNGGGFSGNGGLARRSTSAARGRRGRESGGGCIFGGRGRGGDGGFGVGFGQVLRRLFGCFSGPSGESWGANSRIMRSRRRRVGVWS